MTYRERLNVPTISSGHMTTADAAKLCGGRGYPWCVVQNGDRIYFEVRTEVGTYSMPAGTRNSVQAVNKHVLNQVLREDPPKGFNTPVRRG